MLDPPVELACADDAVLLDEQDVGEEGTEDLTDQEIPDKASPDPAALPILLPTALPDVLPNVLPPVASTPPNAAQPLDGMVDETQRSAVPSVAAKPDGSAAPVDVQVVIGNTIAEKPVEPVPDPERVSQAPADGLARPKPDAEMAEPMPVLRRENPLADAPVPQVNADPMTEPTDPMSVEVSLHVGRETRAEIAQAPASHPPRAAAPHEVARQIAEKLVHSDQTRIEITLTPEELGKVRLLITPGDTPSVAVYAENRETLDLLRRNADLLGKELRDTGFAGASLSFGEDADSSPGRRMEPYAMPRRDARAGVAQDEDSHRPATVSGRQIDMRI